MSKNHEKKTYGMYQIAIPLIITVVIEALLTCIIVFIIKDVDDGLSLKYVAACFIAILLLVGLVMIVAFTIELILDLVRKNSNMGKKR